MEKFSRPTTTSSNVTRTPRTPISVSMPIPSPWWVRPSRLLRSIGIELRLGDRHRGRRASLHARPLTGREETSSRRPDRGKAQEADRLGHIVVNRFHSALEEIRLVPEPRAAGVLQELLPPLAMRL